MSPYRNCMLCPRRCGVNRDAGQIGYCGESSALRLAFAGIHRGEEPPVTGKGGSGTIFVSGCNLGCAFCQNYRISSGKHGLQKKALGRIVDTEEFAGICLALEKHGAENINIVTGSHAIPAIATGIDTARAAGLIIPVLWNTSSYESAEALELLRGRIDIFLPDLKTLDSNLSRRFFNAPDYPAAAEAAINKMLDIAAESGGKAGSVIIRHLILPGLLESTRQVLQWFADNAMGRALLSLMTQYTPPKGRNAAAMPNTVLSAGTPMRYVKRKEYETVLKWLDEFGIDDGYCQELITGSDWLPDFSRSNPFSSELSKPVWHWSSGFLCISPNAQ